MERSLEDFIARANAVSPPSPAARPHAPEVLSDKTEIVSRPLPYTPPGRGLTWMLVALAFAAGGAAVILAVRLVTPRPAPAPTISIVPPVIVIPQPTVEKLPEPVVAPVPVAPVPVVVDDDQPKTPVAAKPAAEPPKKRVKKAEKDPKAPSGLVDPFAE